MTTRISGDLYCPLCKSRAVTRFAEVRAQQYWCCGICHLTFLDKAYFLPPQAELAHYRHHENDPQDAGYRRWLSQLGDEMLACLPPHAMGLDFGSGPGPTLSLMLAEAGHEMAIYDPFFAPDTAALSQRYDFITCTETVEHFQQPALEFARFDQMLRSGGRLGLMTQLLDADDRFDAWWYVRDPTHVAFYKSATLRWIADYFNWQLSIPRKNVAIFQKSA